MKSAAEARDAARLADYVNFPALKESLKGSVNAKIAASTSKEMAGNPFGAPGMALAAAMIGPMVDALVTPENLSLMMKGSKPQPGRPAEESKSNDADVNVSMSYETFDRFVVTVGKKGATETPIGFVFLRDGLISWKLSALRLSE